MAEIKFCEQNFSEGAEEVIEKLKEDGISFEVESCLSQCGECSMGPFALVDDDLVQGEDADDLYEKIKELI
ncbi:hypothetical protein OXPF_30220 [Oxobacter pfennigii]|uniref:DUF1450 domain-containing protein n=1 Tax=Oxobacter pfennigii TaxID=36849 RepID=A0A0P8Y9N1_9CLOT|nr:DUF1450 domain-containing protein [Oxobacter pfennigii]KPU43581.1 hypothetical protein OXPF_30220 [Oxobacter pfennigii]